MMERSVAETTLVRLSAAERVSWALEHLPGTHIVSSSSGIQSAVMLHMATRIQPAVPVVLIDTGYLFAETYAFIDELSDRLACWDVRRFYHRRFLQQISNSTQGNISGRRFCGLLPRILLSRRFGPVPLYTSSSNYIA